jgi:hypothetical protein
VPVVLVPPVVLTVAYLAGRAVAGGCAVWTGRTLPPPLSPFPEVLLGVGLWSWAGFLLAELGVFSPLRAGAALAAGSLAVVLATARGAHARAGWWSAFAGLAAAAVAAALYAPPYETIVMASDASVYFSAGVHLGRAGSISVPDPLLHELGFGARAALLPLAAWGGWTRLPGGLAVASGSGEVMWPTYSHLLPVWIATFARLGGAEAAGLVGPTFAALALWAFFLFARETVGAVAGSAATALLATSAAEVFYARFLMPEIVAQALLWGGFVCGLLWWRRALPAAGVLAALALGVAGLARVEYLVLLPLALVLQGLVARRWPPGAWAFAAVSVALLAHGVAHLALVPTHYREVVAAELRTGLASPVARAAALVGLLLAAVLLTRAGRRPGVRRALAVAIAGGWMLAFASRSQPSLPGTVRWLAETAPWPVLALAAVGLVLAVRRLSADPGLGLPLAVFLLATASFLYDPHVAPSALWALRRFVPVTLPVLYLLAASALPWRRSIAAATAAALVLIVLNALPAATLRRLPLFPDRKHEVATLASRIDPDAAVFFAPELAGYVIHLPLWLVHGRESFVLPPWDWRTGLRAGALALLPRHRVYYVNDAAEPAPAVPGLRLAASADVRFRFVLPGPDASRLPTATRELPLTVRLYEVRAAEAP